MKTDQAAPVLDTDHGVDVKPRALPPLDTPPQPSSTGPSPLRVTAVVLSLLLFAIVATVLAWAAMTIRANQTAIEDSELHDQSITAREHAADAPISQPDPLLDRSIRAREGAVVPQADRAPVADQRFAGRYSGDVTAQQNDSQLIQSARAREHAELTDQRDSLLIQSVRARERAELADQRDSLLTKSIRARER
jgi:hypothetical protein